MHFKSGLLLALSAGLSDAAVLKPRGTNPKRGMISDLDPTTASADASKFCSSSVTALSWYYSFGHYPNAPFTARGYEFVMQQFGVDTVASNGNNFKNLNTLASDIAKYKPSHLMTFLEPVNYGVSVSAAVSAWRKYITPLRSQYPNMKIGSPSVINGASSSTWLSQFISQCPDCKFDFLDVHYYWTYEQFQPFVNSWHKAYPSYPIWVSDIGFQSYPSSGPECKQADTNCVNQIKAQITWMDNTSWIQRYTFRGEFKPSTARGSEPHLYWWSFLDDSGNYTPLGKWYLGVS